MLLIFFILFICLLLDYYKLRVRVQTLENLLSVKNAGMEYKGAAVSPLPLPAFAKNRLTPLLSLENEPVNFTPTVAVNREKPEWFLVRWFKEDVLIKIGGILFFLGAAWFVTYAVKAGWLSPGLRIALGLALSLLFFVLGYYRQWVSKSHYLVLTALGAGIMCVTIFAGQIIFSILNPLLALTLLSLCIAYTTYVSLITKTNWLLLLSALAGLGSPLLSGIADEAIAILFYLFVLSTTILLSGYKINCKPLTLLLTVGVLFYENLLMTITPQNWLWFFVILFSALFFASVTFSLVQQQSPQVIDVAVMLIVGINFLASATVLSSDSSVAVFLAALIVGGVGYYLGERQLPNRVIAIYIALATGLVIVGTSLLFSGYTMVLAYIVEFTVAFFLITKLGLPSLVVWTSASLYLIPLLASLSSFTSQDWDYGLWHREAWVLYSMTISLVASSLWLVHKKAVSVYRWSKALAAIFSVFSFFYLYGVIAVVASSLFITTEAIVMTYASWGLLSLSLVFYSLRQNLPEKATYYASLSVLLPTIVSLDSFFSPTWSLGFSHPDGLGALAIFTIVLLITLLLTQQFCKEYDSTLIKFIAGFVVILVSYLFFIILAFCQGILAPNLAVVASYVSYAAVLYGLTSIFVLFRTGVVWLSYTLAALALPVGLSLSSFSPTGFTEGALAPEAVGLFAMSAFCVMLALGLRRHYSPAHPEDRVAVYNWSRILFALAFIYGLGITWSMAHTLVSNEQAISLSLFIYTVVGLFLYQYGKRRQKSDWSYVGFSLLSLVVMRLILVDVWGMELIWRVITFLGIGTMFIAAALLPGKFIKRK